MSDATNLVENDTNGESDVFVRDIENNITARVSLDEDGEQIIGGSYIYYKSISDDGQYIVFGSNANNVITNDVNNYSDVFLTTNPLYTPPVTPPTPHTSHVRSSGYASPVMIATFQAEQEARAKAVGMAWPTTSTTQTETTPTTTTPTQQRTLKYKMTGEDVKQLQIYLNTHNYPISLTGAGSLNNETTYFGLKTKQAVIKFQLANGLVGDGVVGPMTKGKMK